MTANLPRARSLLAAVVALWLVALFARPVAAADPPILDSPVSDAAEQLVGEEEMVKAALADLKERRDITLYVVTLDTIDEEEPALFADGIAAANDLGPREAVLFISFDDRQFGMWTGEELEVGPELIDELLTVLGDDLRAGDPAGGVVGAAANLERLVDGLPVIGSGEVPEPTDEPIETAPSESFPVEPEPPFDGEPGPIDVPPGTPVDLAPAALAVGAVAAVVVGGAGGMTLRRRRGEISSLTAEADSIAARAASSASAGSAAVDALAFEYGDAVAAPFRDGAASAEVTLAQVRAGRSRLAEVKGLDLDPRRTIVAGLATTIAPLEAWSRDVADERRSLDELSAVADERTAELVDGLPALHARHAELGSRVTGFRTVSPSAHAAASAATTEAASDLERLADRVQTAAASLAAGRRPAGVLALREALAAHRSATDRLGAADETAARVDRALAERATTAEAAAQTIAAAEAALDAAPIEHLRPRLGAAREAQTRASAQTDVLLAWEGAREAAHEAGGIRTEVDAAGRAASEAVDLATSRLSTAREYVDHHRDVRSSTREAMEDLDRRLQSLLAARLAPPLELRDAARAIADSLDQVRGRAMEDVAEALDAERRRRGGLAAASGSTFSSSNHSSSSSSSSGSSSSGSSHGGGSSSGGSW